MLFSETFLCLGGFSSFTDVFRFSKFRVPLWRNHWAFRRVDVVRFSAMAFPFAYALSFRGVFIVDEVDKTFVKVGVL